MYDKIKLQIYSMNNSKLIFKQLMINLINNKK